MSDDRGSLRNVSWHDLCPWLIIFRTFGLAISFPLLLLATAGTLLTPVGWRCSELLFVRGEVRSDAVLMQFVDYNRHWPGQRDGSSQPVPGGVNLPYPVNNFVFNVMGDSTSVYQRLVQPFLQLFNLDWTIEKFAYFLFGGLWTLFVWAFFGGAITRVAAMHLGREERAGLVEAVKYAVGKLGAYFAAPLYPLLGVVLIAVPMFLLGLLMRLDVGVAVAGVLWLLVLLGGFLMALLLTGLLFGWPLMWGAISSEGSDSFDALSRSYAYTYQRPLHYLFYSLLAVAFGAVGWLVVYLFSEAVIHLCYWGVSWGTGHERMSELLNAADGMRKSDGLLGAGFGMLQFFNGLVRTIASGFTFSFFWCLATAIYLLLRRDVDQTELDEIFVEDEQEPYGLPPLKPDKAGVPGVAEPDSDREDIARVDSPATKDDESDERGA
jgi:hypothetical protein